MRNPRRDVRRRSYSGTPWTQKFSRSGARPPGGEGVTAYLGPLLESSAKTPEVSCKPSKELVTARSGRQAPLTDREVEHIVWPEAVADPLAKSDRRFEVLRFFGQRSGEERGSLPPTDSPNVMP
jgi:hypothetical protein